MSLKPDAAASDLSKADRAPGRKPSPATMGGTGGTTRSPEEPPFDWRFRLSKRFSVGERIAWSASWLLLHSCALAPFCVVGALCQLHWTGRVSVAWLIVVLLCLAIYAPAGMVIGIAYERWPRLHAFLDRALAEIDPLTELFPPTPRHVVLLQGIERLVLRLQQLRELQDEGAARDVIDEQRRLVRRAISDLPPAQALCVVQSFAGEPGLLALGPGTRGTNLPS